VGGSFRPNPALPRSGFIGWTFADWKTVALRGSSRHNRCQIAFRGFLSNRQSLAALLGADACASDAELLSLAYRQNPAEFVLRLDGEFAAAIIDHTSHSITLAHDVVGMMPLFYYQRHDCFAFATHLAGLIPFAGPAAGFDQEYFADFLSFGQATTDRTPFGSIRRLLPGEGIRWTPDNFKRLRIWSISSVDCEVPVRAAEQEEQFTELLTNAVRGACAHASTVWTELSGGLDSSTVAALLAASGQPNPAAVGVVYPDWPDADEQHLARLVANHLRLPFHAINGCIHRPFVDPPGNFIGEPSPLSYSGSLLREWDRILEEHRVSVLLTGMGGDEVLGGFPGMPVHLSDPLFDGNLRATIDLIKAWRNGVHRSWHYAIRVLTLAPALRHLRGYQVWHVPSNGIPDWIESSYKASMRLEHRSRCRVAPRCHKPGRQYLADVFWLHAMSIANRGQRSPGYDIRHPLLYRPLLEFMTSLPWDRKLLPALDRILHRQAMRGVLPDRVRLRRTKGGGTWSLVEGLRQSEPWTELLSKNPYLVEFGIANPGRWRLAIERARLGYTQSDRYFMAGVSLETWFYQFYSASPEREIDVRTAESLVREPQGLDEFHFAGVPLTCRNPNSDNLDALEHLTVL
jgi:asparagine synthase (glutamine-hydrolysing)